MVSDEQVLWVEGLQTDTPVAHKLEDNYRGNWSITECRITVKYSLMGTHNCMLMAQYALMFALECKECRDAE